MPDRPPLLEESIDAVLRRQALDAPDRLALVMAGQHNGAAVESTLTVSEWSRDAGQAAAYLESVGIGPGDRLALWAQNSLAWPVWLAAAAWRGAALVALHPGLSADELRAALQRSQPAWLLLDETARGASLVELARTVTGLPCDGSARAGLINGLRGATAMAGGDGVVDYRVSRDGRASAPTALGQWSDPACMLFTSGSSGQPKLVKLSHCALLTNAWLTAQSAGILAGDRIASPLPLYHAAGVSSGLVLSLVTQSLWCSSHRFQAERVLSQIKARQCQVIQGVPTMFKAVLSCVGSSGQPDSLRLGFIGGAAVPLALCQAAVTTLGLESMVAIYGQTEFGPTISATVPTEGLPRSGADAGLPLHGCKVRIVDPGTGRDANQGEIWVQGVTKMDGYFGDEAATHAAITPDGWLRTGDLGALEQGRLRVLGRLKSLIIRGGENVAPSEIEDVLREADQVADVCVVPVPSEHWGEEICACVVSQPGTTLDLDELRRWCDSRLSRFKRPDAYMPWPEFPLLASGKVDRTQVQRQAALGVVR